MREPAPRLSRTPARELFAPGDRVRLSAAGERRGLFRKLRAAGTEIVGTIMGFAGHGQYLRVQRDGTKTASCYCHDWWEKAPATDAAPEDMPLRIARLRLTVDNSGGMGTVLVSADVLAELFRQRAALADELEAARARCAGLCDRVAAQSELLSRAAERGGR